MVDSSSIEVNRRARRAKTDRLDVSKLLALLLRWHGGERKVWSVVHVPSPEADAHRQVTREIATVREDQKCVRNRIQAWLVTQGIRLTLDTTFLAHLATAQTGDGRALPPAFRLRLEREWAHLEAIDARMTALAAARDAEIETGTNRVAAIARQRCTRRGVAETRAAVFSAELFGTRTFQNGRQIGAVLGLVPVPYRSDRRVPDPGIRRAGRAEWRRVACNGRGGWVRWQPTSALTQWFLRRFGPAGGRSKRIGIVALARKLTIALWRYVEHGVMPEGATLKG